MVYNWLVKALLFYQSECKHRCSIISNQYSSPYFVFSAIGRIILFPQACVIAFTLTFQFGDLRRIWSFFSFINIQINEMNHNETKIPPIFFWKFFFQYSDIYQHCLKGFTLNFLFLFFLWIKAIAWFFFSPNKITLSFYRNRIYIYFYDSVLNCNFEPILNWDSLADNMPQWSTWWKYWHDRLHRTGFFFNYSNYF